MYNDEPRQQIARFFNRNGVPVTLAILLINVLTFFLVFGAPTLGVSHWIAFSTLDWFRHPWTLLTWPLVTGESPLNLLFALGWFWLFGSSLERSWGSPVYVRFLAAVTALTAVTVYLGSLMVGPGFIAGLWILSGPAIIAWSVANRGEQVSLFFIPLPAPVIAVVGAAMVWYHAGAVYGNPLLGLFALSGCAAAYWYVTKGRSGSSNSGGNGSLFGGLKNSDTKTTASTNTRFRNFDHEVRGDRADTGRSKMDLLGRLRDEQERRRRDKQLEEMFRRSGYDTHDTDERDKK